MSTQVVTPANLGDEFNQGGEISDKITLRIGDGLAKAPDGTINVQLTATLVTVDKTFAEGHVENTGTNLNVSTDVQTPYLLGATVTPTGTANDDRQYEIRFTNPHPDGANYVPVVVPQSNEPNGDEAKVSVVQGSINANGFDVITTVDDNGGTEDPQVFLNFLFRVVEKVNVLEMIDTP